MYVNTCLRSATLPGGLQPCGSAPEEGRELSHHVVVQEKIHNFAYMSKPIFFGSACKVSEFPIICMASLFIRYIMSFSYENSH
jgi:hypothetical protein